MYYTCIYMYVLEHRNEAMYMYMHGTYYALGGYIMYIHVPIQCTCTMYRFVYIHCMCDDL